MKKMIIFWLVAMLVLIIAVPAMAKKVGEIKDNVYIDNTYKFSLATFDGWSTNIGSKDKSPLRLTMFEKSYPVPQEYQGGGKEDFAEIPTIRVLVDTCSSTVDTFIAQLNDPKFESPQKKFFLKNIKILNKDHSVLTNSTVTLQDTKAVAVGLRQTYSREVAQAGSDRADVINGELGGNIFYLVRDGKIYVISYLAEYQNFIDFAAKWKALLDSLKFDVE